MGALVCWQCGAAMTVRRKKPCYVHGEPALGKPIFCSTKCAHVFKSHNPTLTLYHFLGLASQLASDSKGDGEVPSVHEGSPDFSRSF